LGRIGSDGLLDGKSFGDFHQDEVSLTETSASTSISNFLLITQTNLLHLTNQQTN
jgi:hypothetical protein